VFVGGFGEARLGGVGLVSIAAMTPVSADCCPADQHLYDVAYSLRARTVSADLIAHAAHRSD
jgi:hypothetical protein